MPKKRNIIESRDVAIGKITILDEFDGLFRKEYIENQKIRTNYLTISKSKRTDGGYALHSRLEIGETYVTYLVFDPSGEVILERRFNKMTKSVFSKMLFIEKENGKIYITEYNGEKNINFTIKKL